MILGSFVAYLSLGGMTCLRVQTFSRSLYYALMSYWSPSGPVALNLHAPLTVLCSIYRCISLEVGVTKLQ